MNKGIRLNGYWLTCGNCRNRYDIAEVSLAAKRKNQRNLYCPHCGKKVGTVS